jgi:hypothetical protein
MGRYAEVNPRELTCNADCPACTDYQMSANTAARRLDSLRRFVKSLPIPNRARLRQNLRSDEFIRSGAFKMA